MITRHTVGEISQIVMAIGVLGWIFALLRKQKLERAAREEEER